MSIQLAPNEKSLRYQRGLVWLRRDLRLEDNAALYRALKVCEEVLICFVLDRAILDALPWADRRVEFILASLGDINASLAAWSEQQGRAAPAQLIVRHGFALEEIPKLATLLHAQAVFTNHDYEPQAIARDAQVRGALANVGVSFHTFKDQAIFEQQELLTQQGKPYTVFTPYKNAWLKKVDAFYLRSYPLAPYAQRLIATPTSVNGQPFETRLPALQDLDFEPTNLRELNIPLGSSGAEQLLADFEQRMSHYDSKRDFPHIKGVSYLGVHLRFGTISIRRVARLAHSAMQAGDKGAGVWLSALIWRDFFMQILANYPHVAEHSFKRQYDAIRWNKGKQAKELFDAWCQGKTGYPLVDAAMLQLNTTGFMHNRLRMVVGSFLCKDLGLDWRWGEAYFAQHLNDFDLAANNGGWQWVASTGCDAQPYFRVFNPIKQSEKFDADGKFIKRYLPQLAGLNNKDIHAPWLADPLDLQLADIRLGVNYPRPIVDHSETRAAAIARYAVIAKPSA